MSEFDFGLGDGAQMNFDGPWVVQHLGLEEMMDALGLWPPYVDTWSGTAYWLTPRALPPAISESHLARPLPSRGLEMLDAVRATYEREREELAPLTFGTPEPGDGPMVRAYATNDRLVPFGVNPNFVSWCEKQVGAGSWHFLSKAAGHGPTFVLVVDGDVSATIAGIDAARRAEA